MCARFVGMQKCGLVKRDCICSGCSCTAPQVKVEHWNLIESREVLQYYATFSSQNARLKEPNSDAIECLSLNSRVLLAAIMSVQTKETYHKKKVHVSVLPWWTDWLIIYKKNSKPESSFVCICRYMFATAYNWCIMMLIMDNEGKIYWNEI